MLWIRITLCAMMLTGQRVAFAQTPAGATSAQARPVQPPSLAVSLNALGASLSRVPKTPAALSFATFRVRNTLSQLQQLAANWPAESPLDYRTNVSTSVTLLDRALAARDTARLIAVLQALGDDLEVKLEHCTKSGGKLGGSVVVSVRTVQGGQEIRNWQVFYLPKVFDTIGGTTPDRFPKLSSPTSETLVPGRYVMWVRDTDSTRTSDKTTVKVGEGKKELLLDLSVPVGAPR